MERGKVTLSFDEAGLHPHGWEDYTYWLTADLAGGWSRRISEEHRLVYLVDGDDAVVLQARFHY